MITVKQGLDGAYLIYKNRVYVGMLNPIRTHNQLLYKAISKRGEELGISHIYGSALAMIVGEPFIQL